MTEDASHGIHHRWAGRESGPVLALSHPLGATLETWRPQLETLGRHFRLLLWDHRGHGSSGTPPEPWSVGDFGRDFVALLDRLGVDRVHFCGLSLGGMTGQWLGWQAPERVDRLILANTAAKMESPALLRERIALVEREGVAAIVDNVMERWFTPEYRVACPESVRPVRDLILGASAEGYTAASRAICEMDFSDQLGGIRHPVLVLAGRHDQATPPAWGERIATAIPGARFQLMEAAHLSNVEAAGAFDQAVLDFLGE